MVETSPGRLASPWSSEPGRSRKRGYTTEETVLVLVASVAIVGGLIHIGAAVDHFGELPLYTAVFASLAATQIVWAGLVLRGPSRRLLIFGALFNICVVGLWVASRTVGVPIAPRPWVPESVGIADSIETAGELVVVLSLWSVLMIECVPLARIVTARIAPLLVLVLFLTALYGVGAHAG